MIRKATKDDFKKIEDIYAAARRFMAENGNPTQWKNNYPPAETIKADIENGDLYVVSDENDIHGVFAFIIGDDPTYREIDGSWLSEEKYGTIHRIAGDGKMKGIFSSAMSFCEEKIKHLRIDTHPDNKVMQKAIEKHGFEKRGIIIYKPDGSPRFAYEKI